MTKRKFSKNNRQSMVLCSLDDVPHGGARGYQLCLENQITRVIVLKYNDGIYVYENRCPHLGTPLDWVPDQFLDESLSLIQCATHGALFSIDDGFCIAGPCTGQSLRKIPYQVRENNIVISTG